MFNIRSEIWKRSLNYFVPMFLFISMLSSFLRSSHPSVFYKKGFPKKFSKFTEKQLLESLFNKIAGLRHATLFKKKTQVQVYSFAFWEIFKNIFLYWKFLVAASLFCSGKWARNGLRKWQVASFSKLENYTKLLENLPQNSNIWKSNMTTGILQIVIRHSSLRLSIKVIVLIKTKIFKSFQ